MTERVSTLSGEQFAALWNSAASLGEAVENVRAVAELPCPQWAVLARAVACRNDGAVVKRFPGPSEGIEPI